MTANEAIEILLLIRKLVLQNYSWVDVTEDMIRESFNMAISALEPERKKGKWIPIKRRLPNYRETVLLSTFWGVRVGWRDAVREDGTDDVWSFPLEDSDAHSMYVYAWMPMPEPYRGEQNAE